MKVVLMHPDMGVAKAEPGQVIIQSLQVQVQLMLKKVSLITTRRKHKSNILI